MLANLSLEPSGDYISTDLKMFGENLIKLINVASEPNIVELQSLKFVSGKAFNANSVINMSTIITCKIPIFDLFIYNNLSEENKRKVRWTVDDNRIEYSENEISYSLLFIYFMVITRNKVMLDRGEAIPSFITRFSKIPMTASSIYNCLSENNLNLFKHTWVKSVDLNLICQPLRNRFKQGIAGMRLFNVLRDNAPDMQIDSSTELLYQKIKDLASEGPFWEMHSLFQSTLLSSYSIAGNLSNLILELYSDSMIKKLVENKILFKYPVFNPRHMNYKNWDNKFFDEFKTKMIID